jgi:N-acetyl-gamma-glutamyl-phosphate reductase
MEVKKITKVGILGATGFTGEKLAELLFNHPLAEITYLSAKIDEALSYSKLFPKFKGKIDLVCQPPDIKKATKSADVFFLALPHTVSMQVAPPLLREGKKVIDLSADYRLKDTTLYKKYYKVNHKDKKNLKIVTYGLVEFFRDQIKKSRLIANPGCYAISIILPLIPLLRENLIEKSIIVDAKSSITGAGRKPSLEYHYTNISSNIWAYRPFIHQHLPEIVGTLRSISGRKVELNFVPHIVGVEGGIYSTIYLDFKKRLSKQKLFKVYSRYYKRAPFVRIRKSLPRLKEVVGTNFCDIGFCLDSRGKRAVVCSCIDNLIKGAAGNAIQNMNVMCGFKETEGLL